MPLTLITGPANAAKAGAVLERLRASLSRNPVLVVPTSADERHYARELAGAGLVFGADVTTFPRLIRDIARKAGVRGRPLGRLAQGRVVRAAIRDVGLRELAASAAGPGFPDALGDLFAELQRSLAGPARFGAAVRAWREAGTAPPHAAELAALYSAYHRRLEALGAVDADGLALLALNGLRDAWDGRPILLYGFDDLTPGPAGPGRDAGPPYGHRRHGGRDLRAGPGGDGGKRGHGRAAQAAGARARDPRAALGALRRKRPRRAAPPRARAVRAGSGPRRPQRRRAAAGGRRRARRGRAGRRVRARAPARRHGARGHRRPRALGRRALRPGLRDLRDPGGPRAPHAVRPHAARRGPAGVRARRARRGHGAGRRHLAAHARASWPTTAPTGSRSRSAGPRPARPATPATTGSSSAARTWSSSTRSPPPRASRPS